MTYYLKYRPQTLNELDSFSVRESLIKIMSSGNIPHAFLFSGPRGTGKTSAARIIAKIVNCENPKKKGEPCNKCEECTSIIGGSNIDVIEIDAASNRGIDDIRALRDSVKLSPVRGFKKVYIIDEAHMLTSEASNALLKTLEEPPDHALFILATTNPEKLIQTIRSRVTEIIFKKASTDEISSSLSKIVKGEKLKLKKEVVDFISKNSDGSFRDGAKLLEQVVSEKIKDLKQIERWMAVNSQNILENMIKLLIKRDDNGLIKIVEGEKEKGVSVKKLTDDLLGNIKDSILAKSGIGKDLIPEISRNDLFSLVELLLKAEDQTDISLIEELPLEIALIKWCEEGKNRSTGLKVKEEEDEEEENEKEENKNEVKTKDLKESSCNEQDMENDKEKKLAENETVFEESEVSLDIWKKILETIRPINTSIEALLRAAKPICFDGRTLKLGVYYKFHKERLEEGKYKRILEDTISQVMETKTRVFCTLTEAPPKKTVENKQEETMILEETEDLLTKKGDNDIIELAKKMFNS